MVIQGWYIERITYNGAENYGPSLALHQQNVYIIYPEGYFPGYGTLHLRIGNIGNWVDDTVLYSCSYDYPWHAVIRMDTNNKLHIIFSLAGTHGLWYATNVSGSWEVYPLPVGSGGDWPQFILDRGNNIHLVYGLPFPGGIYYANNVSGNWEIKWNCNFGFYPSIALDSSGYVHIVFDGAYGGGGLYHVTNSSGQWTMEQIIPPYCSRLAATDIKIDYMQNIHITYRAQHESGSPIYYALGYANNIGGWNYTELDSMIRHDSQPSLVIDKFGNVHIVYTKSLASSYEMYYITNKNGLWEKSPVTSNSFFDDIYWIPSFEIDSMGYGHIVWNGYPNGWEEVFYAVSDSSLVKIEERFSYSFPFLNFLNSNIFYKNLSPSILSGKKFAFKISTSNERKIYLYDVTGKRILEISPTSNHILNLKSGVYFIGIKRNGKEIIQKFILFK